MFNSLKNLFAKAVELPSSFFKSEIVSEEPCETSDFIPSEIHTTEKRVPKIKQLKQTLNKK